MRKPLFLAALAICVAITLKTSLGVEPINSATTTTYTVTETSTNILTTATRCNFILLTNDGGTDVEFAFATSVTANQGHILKPNGALTLDTKMSQINLSVKAVSGASRVTLTKGIQ